jgi:hypothetical protein
VEKFGISAREKSDGWQVEAGLLRLMGKQVLRDFELMMPWTRSERCDNASNLRRMG